MFRIAVDIGGTFTDGIIEDTASSLVWLAKALTTPDDPGEAVTTVVADLLRQVPSKAAANVVEVVHGNTIVTNTLIERKGAKVALITTSGTKDVIDIGRELRYDLYDLGLKLPQPLVPSELRFEVDERMGPDGSPVVPLSDAAVERVVSQLAEAGVEAVAICFLHAFINDLHEIIIEQAIKRRLPHLLVSTSSRAAREIREYERTTTTTANAYVQPKVARYLGELASRMSRLGIDAPLRIMVSSGGFTSASAAAEVPIALLESGPAGGVLSAKLSSVNLGYRDALAFDMGGTTAKLSVIIDGEPSSTHMFETARVHRFRKGSGLPILIPSIDLIEIGAGGGSIATCNSLHLLKVGPESAGSCPGPACYGLGGSQPTVTDADLVLGYLDSERFLGGEMRLDRSAAMEALDRLGAKLGLNAIETAKGVFDVVNENMVAAARVHIAEKGYDPRQFTLVSTGGAGPVHAVELARRLGIRRIICPIAAGAGSCLGFLSARARADRSWSNPVPLHLIDWQQIARKIVELRSDAEEELAGSGVDFDSVNWTISVEMRFAGQGATVVVETAYVDLSPEFGPHLMELFEARYAQLYGGIVPSGIVETVTWRLRGMSGASDRRFAWPEPPASVAATPRVSRPIFIPALKSFAEVPVYERYRLPPGTELMGPLVLEERESTLPVPAEARVTITEDRTVLVELL